MGGMTLAFKVASLRIIWWFVVYLVFSMLLAVVNLKIKNYGSFSFIRKSIIALLHIVLDI